MKRLLIISAVAAATLGAAVPAFAGIAGNPSFSHKIPVRVPVNAQVVTFDDHGGSRHGSAAPSATPSKSVTPSKSATPLKSATPSHSATKHPEPGDDNGGLTSSPTTHVEPGDDKGGLTSSPTTHVEPGDDKGGLTTHVEPGDDKGQSGRSSSHGGSDDSTGATHK
jgi:hypothetical protein